MDAVKFLKKYHKLCDPRSCDDCPLLKRVDGFKTCLAGERNGYEERVVEIVEKWSKEQENKMTRQEAIYQIKNLAVLSSEKDMASITEALEMAIEALEQVPKRGKWIDVEHQLGMQCSECGKMCNEITLCTDMMTEAHWNYCPNCGARME